MALGLNCFLVHRAYMAPHYCFPSVLGPGGLLCWKSPWQFQGLDSYQMFNYFQFCIHWRDILLEYVLFLVQTSPLHLFPHMDIFLYSLLITIHSLWGCCGSPPCSPWFAGEGGKTWLGILDLVNLSQIQSIQMTGHTPFLTICNLSGGFWTITDHKIPAVSVENVLLIGSRLLNVHPELICIKGIKLLFK